ncbi:LPXTG cell wall anchor domain-containing protein [Myroides injenensis]|uniref:LPXTG cell wall anchor domain-containing protein n=1 Tax=Myroides injenensis TaxID=1183151 RepID=UPI000288153A|nr:LPXTG cell wall anchor domain-containing protein [Myroides injenensis]
MKKPIILTAALLSFISISFAQSNKNTIDDQFTKMIQESNSYQTYKVVSKNQLDILQKNVRDSISQLHSTINNNNKLFQDTKATLDSLTTKLNTSEVALNQALERENNLEVFGIGTHKSTFQTIVWSIIGILLLTLAIVFFRFKKSHTDTKDALKKLTETEHELEEVRRMSLEREQKIRRQLQDEINKNKQA